MKFSLLPRKKQTDKSAYGHALVIAGSKSYPGAAILTAQAALRSGAGLVTLAAPLSVKEALWKRFSPEVTPIFLSETKEGAISGKVLPLIQKIVSSRRINAVALGPGLTHELLTKAVVRKIITGVAVPAVLDADGLNAFQGHEKALRRHAGPLVLTPHDREFERLFGQRMPSSDQKKAMLAKKLSRSYDVVLVLKGHRTLIVYHDKIVKNLTGNPGMAKGGSGDVLTGIIAAFMAQGLDPFQAAVWGVYFHGKAGDLAVRKTSELSLTASDLMDTLPLAFGGKK